ncbi:MAG: flavin reductase family protein [Nakamurella sp.]
MNSMLSGSTSTRRTAPVHGLDRCFSAADFRSVMGQFITGVTVVTLLGPHGPHGTTVNSFSSLSLDPPLVLICLRKDAFTARALADSSHFGVSILGSSQHGLGRHFASTSRPSGASAFSGVDHHAGQTGVPLLDGAVAHLECAAVQFLDAGDHTIFIGEVIALNADPDNGPLAFHRGRFVSVA